MRLPSSARPSPARRGVTLLEVLFALFVTGIVLLMLLTLYPAGALSVAEAIPDDRAAGQIRTAVDNLNESVGAVFRRLCAFLTTSAANGAADPAAAADLLVGFEEIGVQVDALDATLRRNARLLRGEDRKRLTATLTLGAQAKRQLQAVQAVLALLVPM